MSDQPAVAEPQVTNDEVVEVLRQQDPKTYSLIVLSIQNSKYRAAFAAQSGGADLKVVADNDGGDHDGE